MQAWMEGYESDIEYTAGYYREQEPDFLNLCLITQGIKPIEIEHGFTYCELGCGFGLTSLIMAANYPQGKFYAIDFNPAHIARARSLAKEADIDNIIFLEKSFADINQNSSLLPECDFIVLHGIFTWVSDENRQHIIDICSKHVRSGGLVYNSYNAKPGWSLGEPIQKMMIAAGKLSTGSSIERFDFAINIMDELLNAESRYVSINPELISARVNLLKNNNKNYLIHEYFNEGWRAFYFSEIAEYITPAKLRFIGEANAAATYTISLLPEKAKKFLLEIKDKNVQELFKDVILNTIFRKDIYLRGIADTLDSYEQYNFLNSYSWNLKKFLSEDKKKEFKFKLVVGEVISKKEVYASILKILEHESLNLLELQSKIKVNYPDLIQAIIFLYQEQIITPVYQSSCTSSVLNLNRIVCSTVLNKNAINYIALPYSRTSVALNMVEALFYKYTLESKNKISSGQLIEKVAEQLEIHNLFLQHENIKLIGSAMRDRLVTLEMEWRTKILPILIRGGALALN